MLATSQLIIVHLKAKHPEALDKINIRTLGENGVPFNVPVIQGIMEGGAPRMLPKRASLNEVGGVSCALVCAATLFCSFSIFGVGYFDCF